jgi:hypothetical protein
MKSVMTVSALCKPARTEMMSELGLVYFLARAASRKTVKVWRVSQRSHGARWQAPSYLEGDLVGRRPGLFDANNGAREELLRARLLVQHVVGRDRVEDQLQPRWVGPVQEELLPEAFGQVDVLILVLRAAASVVCLTVCRQQRMHTLNSVSYSWIILGWNTSGRDTCVSGDGSMAACRESRVESRELNVGC